MALDTFLKRRQVLLSQMLPGSAALIFAALPSIRSADTEYPFRQHSDFWYFTEFNETDALLVLIRHKDGRDENVLFNRIRDKQAEIWSGSRLGQEEAPQKLGLDRAIPWDDVEDELPLLLNGLNVIYHAQGDQAYADEMLFTALDTLRQGSRRGLCAPLTITDWRPWVHEMRLIKSNEEIEYLRCAAQISALAHLRAMEKCRPGLHEYHLEGEIHYVFSQHGARFPAYNTIVASGENACILHYTENTKLLENGDLVLIDAGCEYKGYAGDISRTFPVNGKFTEPQRALYDLVLASLNQALLLLGPGTTIAAANAAVVRTMVAGLLKLGILKGELEQLVEEKAYRRFFMHGLGHWLGLDVHDVGDYATPERSRPLVPGMVLTVEPGLYIPSDGDVPEKYRGIGVRIEDDILITESGHENLTESVVKDPDAIERLMLAARQRHVVET